MKLAPKRFLVAGDPTSHPKPRDRRPAWLTAGAFSLGGHLLLGALLFAAQASRPLPEKPLRATSIKGIFIDAALLGGGVKKRPKALPPPEVLPIPRAEETLLPAQPAKSVTLAPPEPTPHKTEKKPVPPKKPESPVSQEKPATVDPKEREREKAKTLAALAQRLEQAEGLAMKNDDDRPPPSIDNFEGTDSTKLPGRQGFSGQGGADEEALRQVFAIYAHTQLMPNINKAWIYSNIAMVKRYPELYARILVRLDSEGRILEVSVDKASGIRDYDESCVKAIKRSEPLPPPPAEAREYLANRGIVLGFPGKLLLEKLSGDLQ